MKRITVFSVVAMFVSMSIAHAQPFNNSLWLGNDLNGFVVPVKNTDTTGNVLRTLTNTQATGFAVDVPNGKLYIAGGVNALSERDLTTLTELRSAAVDGIRFFEDLTFDGTNIWGADYYGLASFPQGTINKIDPTTFTLLASFTPVGILHPVGIAWDGSGLWVSGCVVDDHCLEDTGTYIIKRFDTAGNPTGESFTASGTIAGLGFDPRDQTLYIGGIGIVHHFTTNGTLLSSFSTGESTVVDGLEFEGAPTTTELTVDIDIQPGPTTLNCIKKTNTGVLPVTIFGDEVDVHTIDLASLQIDDDSDPTTPGVHPIKSTFEDKNLDGILDLTIHFNTKDLNTAGLLRDDIDLFITGTLSDGTEIEGSDHIYLAGGPHCH